VYFNIYTSSLKKIKNEHIKEITGVKEKPDITDVIERKRLQWYGHVKRMQEERLPKLIMEWIPVERRKRGRQKKKERGWKVYEQP
jgi:IS5 family transposase